MSDQANRAKRGDVFLPQTSFALRADLPRMEEDMLLRWEAEGHHQAVQDATRNYPEFVLHDGPPYANGHIHVGHALNKVLKDLVCRAARMSGRHVRYVPGWDCHGLPIEWKVEERRRAVGLSRGAGSLLDFRAECRTYAAEWMAVQADEFRRLGVVTDWNERYATMDPAAESVIAAELGKFLLNGSLYSALRPVHWSPVEHTALAEAEIEYREATSPAVHLAFEVEQSPLSALRGACLVAWTTTPWTVPGNRALAYNSGLDYVLLEVEACQERASARVGDRFLVAKGQAEQFCQAAGLRSVTERLRFKGVDLCGTTVWSPLRQWDGAPGGYGTPVPLLDASFVTGDVGTGLVHVAPAHGEDDFLLARAAGLEVPEVVGDDGTYSDQAHGFTGTHVLKGDAAVMRALRQCGTLLSETPLRHQLPHSWRSGKPLILKATPQWFIALDGETALRAQSLEALNDVRFVPEAGRTRLRSMLASRPDWCVSRQRAWGVPLPVFVHKATGEPLRDPAVLDRVTAAFREEGADAWYQTGAAQRFLGADRSADDYRQVMDVVDVWFESGCSHAFVLRERGLPFPADLYLEGSDQHRGWFQSSLLESVATNGQAPFRAVLTHGFVLDEAGRKMSKSQGNVVAPQDVVQQYGADVLRLWAASADTSEDLRVGKGVLGQQAEVYRRFRNTMRYLLGALDGFVPAEAVPYEALPDLERWVLHRLWQLDARFQEAVRTHQWSGVYAELHAFCATDLSAFFFDVRKDVLYCDPADSLRRRAVRTVMDLLQRHLCLWLAPVLVFTSEEAWTSRFGNTHGSVHAQKFPSTPECWRNDALAVRWERIRTLRSVALRSLEAARQGGAFKAFLEAEVVLEVNEGDLALLSEEAWAEVLVTAAVHLSMIGADKQPSALSTRATGERCDRCRRTVSVLHDRLCLRCNAVTGPEN